MAESHGSWSRGLLSRKGLANFSWEGTALANISSDLYPLLNSHIRSFSLSHEIGASITPKLQSQAVVGINGPLVALKNLKNVALGEVVTFTLENGTTKKAEILEIRGDKAIAVVYRGTPGIQASTSVERTGDVFRMPFSDEMRGRIFDGLGNPIDGGPPVYATEYLDINGRAMNPTCLTYPNQILQTGISVIDVMNTISRGQTIPIFSAAGLPHDRLVDQILRQTVPYKQKLPHSNLQDDSPENFLTIFAALGTTLQTPRLILSEFQERGKSADIVMFYNSTKDYDLERLVTPRIAITAAEYFAFAREQHVMVIMTDMSLYADTIREIYPSTGPRVSGYSPASAHLERELASLYQRSGCARDFSGSITQIPVFSLPNDSIHHPIPQVAGNVAEGQIYLERDMANNGFWPPINPLLSQSRVMKSVVGTKKQTRGDHWSVANQLSECYAKAKEARTMCAVVGKEGLSKADKIYLKFLENFEETFLKQEQMENRSLEDSLALAWKVLSGVPREKLTWIEDKYLDEYHCQKGPEGDKSAEEGDPWFVNRPEDQPSLL